MMYVVSALPSSARCTQEAMCTAMYIVFRTQCTRYEHCPAVPAVHKKPAQPCVQRARYTATYISFRTRCMRYQHCSAVPAVHEKPAQPHVQQATYAAMHIASRTWCMRPLQCADRVLNMPQCAKDAGPLPRVRK